METDPRPLHLDIISGGGIVLMAAAGLLAAFGHPLSAQLHEALLGSIGAIAAVASIVQGRIRARQSRKEFSAVKAGTEKAMEVLAVLKNFEPLDHDGKASEKFAQSVTDALAEVGAALTEVGDALDDRVTAPREPVPEDGA